MPLEHIQVNFKKINKAMISTTGLSTAINMWPAPDCHQKKIIKLYGCMLVGTV